MLLVTSIGSMLSIYFSLDTSDTISNDDIIHIYVDFVPIVSTTSFDDALALLIAMYAIFELNFNKNSRTVRLICAIAFGYKRFLHNTIRNFIQEKGIDIYIYGTKTNIK